ncbi:hypothetical protein DFJ63DRAFT_312823 [Scheffersomyces coipomensis]|uniref:uncharacterized protein n=1 Tax=Scheffersomyces coipomensis TaxID=1788519 RepID=UPI00315D5143
MYINIQIINLYSTLSLEFFEKHQFLEIHDLIKVNMGRLEELLSLKHLVKFYIENQNKSINLFSVLEDDEVGNQYINGLRDLESFLNNMEPNSISKAELLKFVQEDDIDNFKPVLILLYKLINSFYVINDISTEEYETAINYQGSLISILIDGIAQTGLDFEKIKRFTSYTITLKFFRTIFQFQSEEQVQQVQNDHLINLNTTSIIPKNTFNSYRSDFKYDIHNSFFGLHGFYYPKSTLTKSSFLQKNLSLFNITPNKIQLKSLPRKLSDFDEPSSERLLEDYMLQYMRSVKDLFFDYKVKVTKKPANIIFDENNSARCIPDIKVIINNQLIVPIELKKGGVREKFEMFQCLRDKGVYGCKAFVELFSQGFLQAITCTSGCFILSDYDFSIGVVLDLEPLENSSLSGLRGVSRELIPFDPIREKLSIPIFFMAFIIKYCKKLDDDKFKLFKNSIALSLDEKNSLTKQRYQKLSLFHKMLSKVPPANIGLDPNDILTSTANMPPSAKSEEVYNNNLVSDCNTGDSLGGIAIDSEFIERFYSFYSQEYIEDDDDTDEYEYEYEDEDEDEDGNDYSLFEIENYDNKLKFLEGKFFKEFDEDISLVKFSKLIKNHTFKRLDISSIKIKSFLSGDTIYKNYSTIIEDEDNFLYKVFDPIRDRLVASNSFNSFGNCINKSFASFVREASSYSLLQGKNVPIPKFVEIGYIENKNRGFMQKLEPLKEISLSGCYIKLSKEEGLTLDKISLTDEIEQKVLNVIKRLHARNISHGDVHLGNFLYNEKLKSIVVIDFGKSHQAFNRGYNNLEESESERQREKDRFEQRVKWDLANVKSIFIGKSKKRSFVE